MPKHLFKRKTMRRIVLVILFTIFASGLLNGVALCNGGGVSFRLSRLGADLSIPANTNVVELVLCENTISAFGIFLRRSAARGINFNLSFLATGLFFQPSNFASSPFVFSGNAKEIQRININLNRLKSVVLLN